MKVLHINSFGNLSTGRIAADICRLLKENGDEGTLAYSRNTTADDISSFQFGSKWSVRADGILTRLTDRAGFYSVEPTRKLIAKIREYDPDIIHLHNLHGYYLNIELLFNYLKESGKPVVWTLHDCWPFTGHCAYFDFVGCRKWQTGCHDCPQTKTYPASLFIDNSAWNWQRKKELFTGLPNMVLVTPSNWLAALIKKSFLSDYSTEVIHNGVDTKVFKPTYGTWIKDHQLENKKIVLGVASKWTKRKGLEDLIKLSEILPEKYKVVVVGVDEKQLKSLPAQMPGIKHTDNVQQLAEIYTAAHVFVNPTYEDNYPTVNLEAIACGTPVITYNTGGSPEMITPENGFIVEKGDIGSITQLVINQSADRENVIKSAQWFDNKEQYKKYLALYSEI